MSVKVRLKKANLLKGKYLPPPDKSISHRAAILLSISEGTSIISNFLKSEDTLSTLNCLKSLGVPIERNGNTVTVKGAGLSQFKEPENVLNAGNSATTMRILTGLLSGFPFFSVITGDRYLNKRPMKRIIEPLSLMGASIDSRSGGFPPLAVKGGNLQGIEYRLPVASAQVKTSVLLAGLKARGQTTVVEPQISRDHTERMLKYLGCSVQKDGDRINIEPTKRIISKTIRVPGDISSASFIIAAAVLLKGSEVVIKNVGINPTRTGMLEILNRANVEIKKLEEREHSGEPISDLLIKGNGRLESFKITEKDIPRLIDEIPILSVMATQASGTTVISGAYELRLKETDRLKWIAHELSRMGAEIKEHKDGLEIKGRTRLRGTRVFSHGDHRIAMALSIAGLIAEGETVLENADCIKVSYPMFFKDIEQLVV